MKRFIPALVFAFTLFMTSQIFAQNKNSSQSFVPTTAVRSASPTMLLVVGAGVAVILLGLAFAFRRSRNS